MCPVQCVPGPNYGDVGGPFSWLCNVCSGGVLQQKRDCIRICNRNMFAYIFLLLFFKAKGGLGYSAVGPRSRVWAPRPRSLKGPRARSPRARAQVLRRGQGQGPEGPGPGP